MTAGALDQHSAKLANALVGQSDNAALLEILMLDFSATTSADLLVAVTGAPGDVRVAGAAVPQYEPFMWPAHTTLTISNLRLGSRAYLAVRGRLDTPKLMDSCAPDSVLGFSGPLHHLDHLDVITDGVTLANPYFGIPVLRIGAPTPRFTEHWQVPVTDGPDRDQFAATAARLFDGPFVVGPNSNHVGLRLRSETGTALPVRTSTEEVLSRGVPIGAVEVPTGEELLVLHRGRGVTAGYPVLAVVTSVGLSRLGQARPGHRVTFVPSSVPQAVAAAREQQTHIDDIRRRTIRILGAHGVRAPEPDLTHR